MKAALVFAALLWPAVLSAALVDRLDARPAWWGTAVYLAASRVCHQMPERSFHVDGQPWPVCARCAGLYLAAPLGALVALYASRHVRRRGWSGVLAIAAAPSAATWLFEFAWGGPVSNLARAVAALPLGAAVAFVLIVVASRRGEPIG